MAYPHWLIEKFESSNQCLLLSPGDKGSVFLLVDSLVALVGVEFEVLVNFSLG